MTLILLALDQTFRKNVLFFVLMERDLRGQANTLDFLTISTASFQNIYKTIRLYESIIKKVILEYM